MINDFNAFLYAQDRYAGNLVQYNKLKDFAECIHESALYKMLWRGDYYTWSNRQLGIDRIESRIDRTLGNNA